MLNNEQSENNDELVDVQSSSNIQSRLDLFIDTDSASNVNNK